MQVQRNGKWLSAMVGTECVMMSIETGNYVTLSRVGTRIWELIETPTAVSDLCAKLLEEFNVTPEICDAEVATFLAELAACRAITLSPAS